MTHRLYYTNAYTTSFTAQLLEQFPLDSGQVGVLLDQSYFYPLSGGQPADRGTLSNRPVLDVSIRPSDGAVIHHLSEPLPAGEEVIGQIDWPRRFDLMQQHTGQHILSQAFVLVAEADTVGFHLNEENLTIDLNRVDLTAAQIAQAEQLANQIIWENRPVSSFFVSPAELSQFKLRKQPPAGTENIRLVSIENFDLNACGGTHVSQTGAVGCIKITRVEKRKDKLRLEFKCGGRALADYEQKNNILLALNQELTTSYSELHPAVQKLKAENQENRRSLRHAQEQLLAYEVERYLQTAPMYGGVQVVAQAFTEVDPEQMRLLAAQLTDRPGVVALLATAGEKPRFLFKRSADVPQAMNQLLKDSLQVVGFKSGGGTPELAQGGGGPADLTQVEQVLTAAVAQFRHPA